MGKVDGPVVDQLENYNILDYQVYMSELCLTLRLTRYRKDTSLWVSKADLYYSLVRTSTCQLVLIQLLPRMKFTTGQQLYCQAGGWRTSVSWLCRRICTSQVSTGGKSSIISVWLLRGDLMVEIWTNVIIQKQLEIYVFILSFWWYIINIIRQSMSYCNRVYCKVSVFE